jgi:hypothetical protein
MSTKTIYLSIGNSDDKLTQREWSMYRQDIDNLVRRWAGTIHGAWVSPSAEPWQNACWCFEWDPQKTGLKLTLAKYAAEYGQDSIAWAEAPVTEFITPTAVAHGQAPLSVLHRPTWSDRVAATPEHLLQLRLPDEHGHLASQAAEGRGRFPVTEEKIGARKPAMPKIENPKVTDAFARVGLVLARFRGMGEGDTVAAVATADGTERLTYGHLRDLQSAAYDAGDRLQRIAAWHSRETAEGGLAGDYCNECGYRWPCETWRMADGTHEDLEEER